MRKNKCQQFLSILYWRNSEYWSQKCIQNGNIHSIKLDACVDKQSASNPFFISSQHKQGRKYNALASSPSQLVRTCAILFNSSVGFLFAKSWKLTREHKILEKKLRHVIQFPTANGLRNASGPVLSIVSYINSLKIYQDNIFDILGNVYCQSRGYSRAYFRGWPQRVVIQYKTGKFSFLKTGEFLLLKSG